MHWRWLVAGLALTLANGSCRSKSDADSAPSSAAPAASVSARPLDRLAPGELAAGSASAFGFPIPEQMNVDRMFPDAVHASGNVSANALVQYVQERVIVANVEVAGARTIFPNARIRGGGSDHTYRLEVVSSGPNTLLVIRDVTPAPAVEGLSQAERWRRAGMTPDGKPLNPKQLR
jgi:hypothetical protein